LFVATNDSAVMVFERTRVVGIDPANGRERWQSLLPAPDGPGDWVGTSYVCPTLGGWSIIDSATGQVRRSEEGFWWDLKLDADRKKSAAVDLPNAGRLTRVGSRWAVLSPNQLGVFENIAARQKEVAQRAQSKPDDVDARVELAMLARQFGDLDKSEELARSLLNDPDAAPKAAGPLREVLLRQLSDQPAEHSRLAEELFRLSSNERWDVETRHALVEAAKKTGDLVAALRAVLELLGKLPAEDVNVIGQVMAQGQVEDVLHVRRDRWVQGIIADLLAQADNATRAKLLALLDEQRQRAFESPDAFALQTFAERLSCLPLGRELRMQLSGRTGSGVGYLKTSLALREIAQGTDRSEAAQAWYRLALLHDFRSEPLDAADCYRELRDRFADVKLADGRGSAEWLADVMPDSLIGRALADGPRDPWPVRLPKVTSQEESHDDVYCYQITVESRDPFWRRMSAFVERQGRKVRFTGGGQRGLWEVTLPPMKSYLRQDWLTHRGWGLGPMLVVQVGECLHGIQPLDERGETNAKVLWTISTGPYEETGPQQMLPAQLGVRLDQYRHLDRHEQPVLDVVHASAGLLCYRTRNRLNVIDPVSGEWLWARHRLPPQASVSGDGEHIVLRLLATQEIEVRRGFDGKLLERRSDDSNPNGILIEQGRLRLSSLNGKPDETATAMKLLCQDVVTGESLWQRELPAHSVVLKIDDSRFGVVEPAGMLRFFSLSEGQELSKHEVSLPKSLSTAHVLADDQRLFVILSGPVTETSWLGTQQDRGGYHRPLLNGWVQAFDRRSLQSLWTIPAKNLPFALDQPLDSPFFVLPYKRPSDDSTDGQHSDGVLHLIDKRTGKEVLYDVGGLNNVYFALEPDAPQQRIDVLTTKRRLRLDYGEQ
jgi:outer membrane protein assembly factor BamB